MRTIAILSLALGAACFARPQAIAQLGEPVGLDVRVNWVNWHDQGGTLMYTREMSPSGLALGLFRDGDKDGKVVLQIGESDQWRAQWFPKEKKGFAIIGRGGQGAAKDQIEWSIYWLDAKARTTTKIYTKLHAPGIGVTYEPEVSPLLSHVVIDVREGKSLSHLVIPAGSSAVVQSFDLDQAVAAGASGPFWSLNGTACYHSSTSAASDEARIVGDKLADSFQVAISGETKSNFLADLPLLSFRFKLAIPPAERGAPVLELMPMNATLRQIRFGGPFVAPPKHESKLFARTASESIEFGILRGYAQSLWIADVEEEVPMKGVLVAPRSELSWLAPNFESIAYLVDGALFVRSVI